jgi:3-oxoacyl-[acyl-carrier-protein] synthase-3
MKPPVYISAFSSVLGEKTPIRLLNNDHTRYLISEESGLKFYRASTQPVHELALEASILCIDQTHIKPALLIYVTETDPAPINFLRNFLRLPGFHSTPYMVLSGHICGNLGLALELAQNLITTGKYSEILLVSADCAGNSSRLMINGLSVFSDGAAACVVSSAPPKNSLPVYTLMNTASCIQVPLEQDDPLQQLFTTAELGRRCLRHLLLETDTEMIGIDFSMFANYKNSTLDFLSEALGLPRQNIKQGDKSDVGHCYSADLLLCLEKYSEPPFAQQESNFLVCCNGPFSWFISQFKGHVRVT